MQFGLAYRYLLDKRGGFTNLLLLAVCELIPVVGPIVALGYRAEVSEALDRDPDLRRHPDFKFDRFVEYLTRGVWPFLVTLVLALALYIPGVLLAFGLGGGLLAAGAAPAVAIPAGVAVGVVVLLTFAALAAPMTLHAELTARFDMGGAFRFALRFWKLVPGPAVLAAVIFIPLSTLVSLLGLLCCFVGVYLANPLNQMAAQHLMMQLYRLYVDRGGDPLLGDEREPEEYDDYEDERRDYDEDDRDRR